MSFNVSLKPNRQQMQEQQPQKPATASKDNNGVVGAARGYKTAPQNQKFFANAVWAKVSGDFEDGMQAKQILASARQALELINVPSKVFCEQRQQFVVDSLQHNVKQRENDRRFCEIGTIVPCELPGLTDPIESTQSVFDAICKKDERP